jgi:nucleoid DNA-binding protein
LAGTIPGVVVFGGHGAKRNRIVLVGLFRSISHSIQLLTMNIEKNLDLTEISGMVGATTDLPSEKVREVLKASFKQIAEGVATRGYVELDGFGSFQRKKAAAREGTTPGGKTYSRPEGLRTKFRPDEKFKVIVEALTKENHI